MSFNTTAQKQMFTGVYFRLHRQTQGSCAYLRGIHGLYTLYIFECLSIQQRKSRCLLVYTSGSTGKPKGVVHTCGGYMVYTHYTFLNVFQYNSAKADVYWCILQAPPANPRELCIPAGDTWF